MFPRVLLGLEPQAQVWLRPGYLSPLFIHTDTAGKMGTFETGRQGHMPSTHSVGRPSKWLYATGRPEIPSPSLVGKTSFPLPVASVQYLMLMTDFLPCKYQVYSLLFGYREHSKLERALSG